MENNSTATPSFWSKISSVLTDKAVDLADSYAALKLGKDNAPAQVMPSGTTPAPYVAPATVSAPNNTKLYLAIGGGVLAVVLLFLFLRPRGRR